MNNSDIYAINKTNYKFDINDLFKVHIDIDDGNYSNYRV